jgi:hypothetical protein
MIETAALGIAAPDSSVTVPERLPPTTCEYKGVDARNQSVNTIADIQPTRTSSNLARVLIIPMLISPPPNVCVWHATTVALEVGSRAVTL